MEFAIDEANSGGDPAREMIPTHEGISRVEEMLGGIARELGGHEDGWGFMDG
jgi:hypothetical protein